MNLTEAVRALFISRPHEWIDGRQLAQIGGYAAWRTRVSDCRKVYGMRIENEVETRPDLKISRYRYIPERLF